ncbi:MAG: hypothetical protein K2P53_01005 [Rickettsiales bacterium]|nr:hypothetical protein [Rickettsiales bacterium]
MLSGFLRWASGAVAVEQHDAVAGAVGAARIAEDSRAISGDVERLDGMARSHEESAVVRGLQQLLDEVIAGNVNNEVRFKEMQERIEVLEANTFVEAAKWIFEKICELFCKMQKLAVDIGENFPLVGGKATRAREFSDLDKLYEKELARIDKLAGKNELGDNAAEYAALKANAKGDYEERQVGLHEKHEKEVDAKYGKGMYEEQHPKDAAGKFTREEQAVTPQQKEDIWKADDTCRYHQIDARQQEHAQQREKHGEMLAKKHPEIYKAGQYVGEKASEAGQYVADKASAAKQSFAERIAAAKSGPAKDGASRA